MDSEINRKQSEAWKQWIESEKGRKCDDGEACGEFLTNRLWWAFMAGFDACRNITGKSEAQ